MASKLVTYWDLESTNEQKIISLNILLTFVSQTDAEVREGFYQYECNFPLLLRTYNMKEFLLLKHLLKHEHDLSFKNIFGIRTVVTSGFRQCELYLLPNCYNAFQMYI